MLLDYSKGKARRDSRRRRQYIRKCLDLGDVVTRMAEENPEFAARVREVIKESALSEKEIKPWRWREFPRRHNPR